VSSVRQGATALDRDWRFVVLSTVRRGAGQQRDAQHGEQRIANVFASQAAMPARSARVSRVNTASQSL
jgi:hypothetical protein